MHLIDNNATDIRIEDAIKNDLALTFHMLRLANSQAREMHARVDSLAAALENLGRDQLRRWLQVLLHAESANMTPQADFHRSAVAYP
jgi:EAL and modified HD-GYP domain-containing signal transduction protein